MAEQPILTCFHCGNTTPHVVRLQHSPQLLCEIIEEERLYAPFLYSVVTCGTCGGLSLLGGFLPDLGWEREARVDQHPRLYPVGPGITPPSHTVDGNDTIPSKVLQVYAKAWPLRHLNPPAYANQVRRALEYVCDEQEATGTTLGDKLRSLAARGILPPELADMASLVRDVGNRGSHADEREVDVYDAELIDELFKLILRYVYLGPAHVRRLRQRLSI